MCGIAGCWGTAGGEDLREVAAGMSGSIAHRGPDDWGVWVDEGAGVALAHRRLSILDLSAEGAQPMVSGHQRYVTVFNGEIYNFAVLRAELESRGRRFRGHSDTEILLACVEEWGLDASLRRFVGMFAFALWDREEQALYLCRDRMGEKPLYYGLAGRDLVFGSELKALARHPAWSGEIDPGALSLFLRHGYVPGPYSIYRGIGKLPPGCYVRAVRGAVGEPVAYWTARGAVAAGLADPFTGSAGEAVEALDGVLRDAIRQQMVADVPLGAFLSGGVDSSVIVSLMQAQSSSRIRTFSIGFQEEGFDEAVHARAVARHLGTDHTELYVSAEDAMGVIPLLPAMYDEPFADSSQIPTYLVARLARQAVTVCLSGDAGDELFAGYNRYVMGTRIWDRARHVPYPLRRAAGGLLGAVPPHRWDAMNRRLPRGLRQPQLGDRLRKTAQVIGAADAREVYLRLVSEWKDPASVVVGGHEPATALSAGRGADAGWSFAEAMMYHDTVSYLPDDILVKVDRAAMAVSLETRVPFLDHRVVEFAWRIPLSMKLSGGRGKWVLRRVLDRYVPRELIERPKMGFGVPIGHWLRGPLRGWAEELLDEGRLRREGFFEPRQIRQRWQEHLSGARNWQHALWSVLMFQSWHEDSGALGSGVAAPDSLHV